MLSAEFYRRWATKRREAIARHGDAGEIALHVGGEDADAGGGKTFGERLQRHRLAGSGRAGDEAVAVAITQQQVIVIFGFADEDLAGNFLRVFDHGQNCSCCGNRLTTR